MNGRNYEITQRIKRSHGNWRGKDYEKCSRKKEKGIEREREREREKRQPENVKAFESDLKINSE